MAGAQRFEDIEAWKKARLLTSNIYDVTKVEPFRRDSGLSRQVQHASVSVMANIAEGFDRHRDTEFIRFLEIAKGSCAEVMSHPYVALDQRYLSQPQANTLLDQARDVNRTIDGALMRYLQRTVIAANATHRARTSPTRQRGLGTRDSGPGTAG